MAAETALLRINLEASNIEKSISFYKIFLGQSPVLSNNGATCFRKDNPPVTIVLTEKRNPNVHSGILGIQLHYESALQNMLDWLGSNGITIQENKDKQSVVLDPDGNTWTLVC